MSSNILVVLSGPSGAGKSSLVRLILERCPDFVYSVSATTRAPRAGEAEGRDYFFVTPERFRQMQDTGELLEWAEVFGRYHYGTPRAFVTAKLQTGSVIVDVDVQGGLQIMKTWPAALFVFVQTDSIATLEKRIRSRGSMAPDELEARLATARNELTFKDRYDHVITNHNLEEAYRELAALIDSRRQGS